jgi:pantetheine-phosphate adenylyltransferase
MSSTRAVCPGSFDPVTRGHVDVIGRAVDLFDEVIVAVGANVGKSPLFTPAERVEMLERACAAHPGVRVELFTGLLVDFCRDQGASTIVKGLRFAADFDYELPMAQMNRSLTGIETVFLPTAPEWAYVSSSLIREVASLGGDVAAFLPDGLAEETVRRVRSR